MHSAEIAVDRPSGRGESGNGKPGAGTVAWVLAVMCALIVLARLHTYNEPVDRDLATYGVIAHEVLLGGRIYDGVLFDMKPPAIYFAYGVGEMIAGYGKQEIYLLGVAAAIATLFGFYFAGNGIGGSRRIGLWAAAYWTVACGDLWLEANQPNTEVFINVFMVFGLVFLLGSGLESIPWRRAILAGICFALASLFKHVVVIIPVCVGISCIIVPPHGRTRRRVIFDVATIGVVGILAWAGMFIYFGLTGRFTGLVDSIFKVSLDYAGNIGTNILNGIKPSRLFPPVCYSMIPLALTSACGMVAGPLRRESFPWVAMGGLAIGTAITVAMPGHFFSHYYQLWFPFLVIGSALSAGLLERIFPGVKPVRLFFPAVLVAMLINEVPAYFRTAQEWSFEKHGSIFVEMDYLAKRIRAALKPGQTFFQFGEETELYFDTGMRPPTTIHVGVFEGPLAPVLSKRTMDDLTAHPPELLVVGKQRWLGLEHPIWNWIAENYVVIPGRQEEMVILCMKKPVPQPAEK